MLTVKELDRFIIGRHGDPIDDDPKSGLSEEGNAQATLLAEAIQRSFQAKSQIDGVVLSSTAIRATQTAKIIANKLNIPKFNDRSLENRYGDVNVEDAIATLEQYLARTIILIGHEPSLQQILYALGVTPPKHFRQGWDSSFNLLQHGQAYVIDNTQNGVINRLPE